VRSSRAGRVEVVVVAPCALDGERGHEGCGGNYGEEDEAHGQEAGLRDHRRAHLAVSGRPPVHEARNPALVDRALAVRAERGRLKQGEAAPVATGCIRMVMVLEIGLRTHELLLA
jgi:hypothetical protein